MSQKHLTTGSEEPPRVPGQFRLYSMEYCPYAHRTRLVLLAKKVPHDVVNINLINKPEWYFQIHPEGKVPALLTPTGQIVVESLDISDWLDAQFPAPALYPADEGARGAEKALIQGIGALSALYMRVLVLEQRAPAEWAEEFRPILAQFDAELRKRGTRFFGGEAEPGMFDYMLWPWAERSGVFKLRFDGGLPFAEGEFAAFRAWKKAMRALPVVEQIYTGPEKFWKIVQMKVKSLPPDYDSI